MATTGKFNRDDETRIFKRIDEETLENYGREEVDRARAMEEERARILKDIELQRAREEKKKLEDGRPGVKKERRFIYRDEYEKSLEAKEKKGCGSCGFILFLVLVSALSFVLAGYLVLKDIVKF